MGENPGAGGSHEAKPLFSDSIISNLTGLSWISPSRNAILAVGTCAARRLAVREELDKSPCRRCVWDHFGTAALQRPNAPPLCPGSCLWSSSLL